MGFLSSHATLVTNNQNKINRVECYIQNVIPQQINSNNMSLTEREMRPSYESSNSSLSHGNNIITTQMTSMIDIQNNYSLYQNRAEDIDTNKFPKQQIPGREKKSDYDINTNSLQNNVTTYDNQRLLIIILIILVILIHDKLLVDLDNLSQNHNIVTTQSIPTTDKINQNHNENCMPYNNNQDANSIQQISRQNF
jgi:hypothetical protein